MAGLHGFGIQSIFNFQPVQYMIWYTTSGIYICIITDWDAETQWEMYLKCIFIIRHHRFSELRKRVTMPNLLTSSCVCLYSLLCKSPLLNLLEEYLKDLVTLFVPLFFLW